MKRLFAAIRRAPMLSGLVAVMAGALVMPAMLLAWGPDRPTFTYQKPAHYVTFNSITNNPVHGDERNFVQVRNLSDNGKFGENVNLVPGKEYEVSVYYHNNAADYLNSADQDHKGIALNTRMKVAMPSTVAVGQQARFDASITADNAKPSKVWDEAYGKNTSSGTVALRYVPNSAKVTSNGAVNGQTIDLNALAKGDGAHLGYDKLDGKVPGCFKYAGYVTYRFKVDQPNFEVTKKVSETKKNSWHDSVKAKAGDTVDFRIHYKNTGTMTQENVSVRDDLPKGMTLVDGSARYYNSKTNGAWKVIEDKDALTTSGVDFGAFAAGAEMYVALQARITDASKLECGTNKLVNRAVVTTANGTKHDSATVMVDKECKEEPKPEPKPEMVKVCDLDDKTVKQVTKEEHQANPERYSTDLAKCAEEEEDEVVVEEVVTELPRTGITGTLLGLSGIGAMTAAGYYLARRQQ